MIDGPGLAYHIYYRLLAHKNPILNVYDAIPSYAEIDRGTVAFLDELHNYGLTMYALEIFKETHRCRVPG